LGTEEGTAALFPVWMVAGGGGPAGEKGEDVGAHLLVARIRVGVAGGGLAAEEQDRRWRFSPAAVFRWRMGLTARSRSFRRIWRS